MGVRSGRILAPQALRWPVPWPPPEMRCFPRLRLHRRSMVAILPVLDFELRPRVGRQGGIGRVLTAYVAPDEVLHVRDELVEERVDPAEVVEKRFRGV